MCRKSFYLVVVVALMCGVAQAAVVSYSATAPTIGPYDAHSLNESTTDPTNVNFGDDGATYIAHDRPGMGQTFTTGTNPSGYAMTGFWLKNVLYDTVSGNGTWWYLDYDGGSTLEIRVVDPANQTLPTFVVHSEVYTTTGSETGIGLMPEDWSPNKLGTDVWVYFGFDTPVLLAANTQYGFDVTVIQGSWGYFFETAGVDYGSYIGGSAYSTGTVNGTNSLLLDKVYDLGDHTFVVVPEPVTMTLLGLGGLALLRRRK